MDWIHPLYVKWIVSGGQVKEIIDITSLDNKVNELKKRVLSAEVVNIWSLSMWWQWYKLGISNYFDLLRHLMRFITIQTFPFAIERFPFLSVTIDLATSRVCVYFLS